MSDTKPQGRPAEFFVLHDALAEYQKTNKVTQGNVVLAIQYLLIDIDRELHIYHEGKPLYAAVPDSPKH